MGNRPSTASPDAAARRLFAVVDAVLTTRVDQHQKRSVYALAEFDARAAKVGAFGGSGHAEYRRGMQETALSERAELIVGELLATHQATKASLSAAMQSACKDWALDRLAREAAMIDASKSSIDRRLQDEMQAAAATIDRHFDTLRGDRVERVVRFMMGVVRKVIGWLFALHRQHRTIPPSASVAALEMGLAAVAQVAHRDRVVRAFDLLAETLLTDYLRHPIDDEHIDRLRAAMADVRKMFADG